MFTRRKPAAATPTVDVIVPETFYTVEDLQRSTENFLNVAGSVIGLQATVQLLDCASTMIQEQPEMAIKLGNPKVQSELLKFGQSVKGKDVGLMDLMPLIGQLGKILK